MEIHECNLWKKAKKREKEVKMSKKSVIGIVAVFLIFGMASLVHAGDGSAGAAGLWSFFGIALACGFGIGIAALGTGIGMGYAINGALQGTARNPEAAGKIMTSMIIGLALVEALCIYALVICLILAFKIPDLGPMLDAVVKTMGT
jgi:F-type H+-transporting ATPase subunit c